jgi:hypothetical protein
MATTEGENIEGKREYYTKAENEFRTALRISLMGAKDRLDTEAGLKDAVRLLQDLPPAGAVSPASLPPRAAATPVSASSPILSHSSSGEMQIYDMYMLMLVYAWMFVLDVDRLNFVCEQCSNILLLLVI